MRRVGLLIVAATAALFAYGAALAQEPCVHTATACVAINPDVSADTIEQTICTSHWTATVRPSSGYMHGIKIKLGSDAGLAPEASEAMILDHLIPLCLGGHPRAPSNLQLQEAAESYRKDRIELKLQCLVCTGQVPLDEARAAIATDWEAAYHRYALVKCRRPNRVRVTDGGEVTGAN